MFAQMGYRRRASRIQEALYKAVKQSQAHGSAVWPEMPLGREPLPQCLAKPNEGSIRAVGRAHL